MCLENDCGDFDIVKKRRGFSFRCFSNTHLTAEGQIEHVAVDRHSQFTALIFIGQCRLEQMYRSKISDACCPSAGSTITHQSIARHR